MDYLKLARKVLAECRTIATFSDDEPPAITRTFLGESMRRCHTYLSQRMIGAGMTAELDAAGNLRGIYPGTGSASKHLIIGSHLDTVPNGGAFDGILGVVIGLALVESLEGKREPFAIEVIGFSEEEGVRFGVPFIGSRAVAGTLDESTLASTDPTGITIRQAIRKFGLDPAKLYEAVLAPSSGAYLEFHIEQGPVLERLGAPLGVVTSIAGQNRAAAKFKGKSRHAGTTPMAARVDALTAAAEWIAEVERQALVTDGLVATVGRMEVKPGAANVIPGEVIATLDVRHASNEMRQRATGRLLRTAAEIASRRSVEFQFNVLLEQDAVPLDELLTGTVERAIQAVGGTPIRMTSGAGHDAMILAPKLAAAMIFLRSPGGVSHHPDEIVDEADVAAALHAGTYLLQELRTCPYFI